MIKQLYSTIRHTLDHRTQYRGSKDICRGGMHLENRMYTADHLTRIHIEHVSTTPEFFPELSVFHCTMFPDLRTDLNVVLGFDLVQVGGVYTLAIADPTIVYGDDLTKRYAQEFDEVYNSYWSDDHFPAQTRDLPEWGRDFFSDRVVYLGAPIDTHRFCDYVRDLCEMHLAHTPRACKTELADKWFGMVNYCRTQRGNKKTESMLARSLGPTLAKIYMQSIMFPEDTYIV